MAASSQHSMRIVMQRGHVASSGNSATANPAFMVCQHTSRLSTQSGTYATDTPGCQNPISLDLVAWWQYWLMMCTWLDVQFEIV